jgi:Butirosin biosynthesis protein H, N-terminal
MSEPPRPIFVPSVLHNLHLLLEELAGPGAPALLGVRWSFAHFDPRSPALAEFELPVPWSDIAARLEHHGGTILEAHGSDDAAESYERLALGQPVVVAVDSFHLPYRPAFRRVHSARTILLQSLDAKAQTVEVADVWPPSFTGEVPLSVIRETRIGEVTHDPLREPLFAGMRLDGQWWTIALSGSSAMASQTGLEELFRELQLEANGTKGVDSSAAAMESFAGEVCAALCEPLGSSRERRRAAALHLRAEIGLRAYLLEALRLTARVLQDELLTAETARWAAHLEDLGRTRDILIKSVAFERPEHAALVDASLRRCVQRESRFASLMADLFPEPVRYAQARA